MSTENSGIWKWIGGLAAAIIAPVVVYHLTEAPKSPDPTPIVSPKPTSPSQQTTPSTDTPRPPDPPPRSPDPQTTSINVVYRGDTLGCTLPLAISIGNQEFYPQGNSYQASGIEVGRQNYRVSGQIYCPAIGSCQVYGEGTINVVPRNTYYIAWQNTAFGQCSAILQ